jgi:hypothetical protein
MPTESGGSQKEKRGRKQTIEVMHTFICPNCDSASETYSEVFRNGMCRNCGGPLRDFKASISEMGENTLRRSLFLLSGEDTKKAVKSIIEELQAEGINVIDADDIILGSITPQLAANLTFVMKHTLATLVVPSEGLEKRRAIRACLNSSFSETHVDGSNIRLVPIFTSPESKQYTPPLLSDTVGIAWGFDPQNTAQRSKENLISFVKEETARLNSK